MGEKPGYLFTSYFAISIRTYFLKIVLIRTYFLKIVLISVSVFVLKCQQNKKDAIGKQLLSKNIIP